MIFAFCKYIGKLIKCQAEFNFSIDKLKLLWYYRGMNITNINNYGSLVIGDPQEALEKQEKCSLIGDTIARRVAVITPWLTEKQADNVRLRFLYNHDVKVCDAAMKFMKIGLDDIVK